MVSPELPEPRATPVSPDVTEPLATQDALATPVSEETLDLQETTEPRVLLEPRESLVGLLLVETDYPELKEREEGTETTDVTVNPDPLVFKEPPEPRETLAPPEPTESARLVRLDDPVCPAPLE